MEARRNRQKTQLGGGVPYSTENLFTAHCVSLIGKRPDKWISSRFGMSVSTVLRYRGKHGIISYVDMLKNRVRPYVGLMNDQEVAYRCGCSRGFVRRVRIQVGLPPAKGSVVSPELDEDFYSLLGTMSDPKLAKLTGVSRTKVFRERTSLGIVSWQEQCVAKSISS